MASRTRLVDVATLMIGTDGPERLLAHDVHRVVDVDQYGRLVEAAAAGVRVAAGQHLGALRDGVTHMGVDDLELRREDHRADIDAAGAAGGP